MDNEMIWISLLLLLTPVTKQIADSGRVLEIAEAPSERLNPGREVPPGAPPLLAFRYFEGKERHRFGGLDLVIDDAGH